MKDCLFCKIIKGEIPSDKVFENDKVFAFNDIYPMAKHHVLFVHKEHTIDITDTSLTQIQDLFEAIQFYVKDNDQLSDGFRVVTNKGKFGGQSVFHTHLHVLGGEQLKGFGS